MIPFNVDWALSWREMMRIKGFFSYPVFTLPGFSTRIQDWLGLFLRVLGISPDSASCMRPQWSMMRMFLISRLMRWSFVFPFILTAWKISPRESRIEWNNSWDYWSSHQTRRTVWSGSFVTVVKFYWSFLFLCSFFTSWRLELWPWIQDWLAQSLRVLVGSVFSRRCTLLIFTPEIMMEEKGLQD